MTIALERFVREQRAPIPGVIQAEKLSSPQLYAARLLEQAVVLGGTPICSQLGRQIARSDSHPLLRGFRSCRSAEELLERWRSIEQLVNPEFRIEVREMKSNGVVFSRIARAEEPSVSASDALCMGLAEGVLRELGAQEVSTELEAERGLGALYSLRWARLEIRAPSAAMNDGPWGLGGAWAGEVGALLLAQPGLSVAGTARVLGASSRTLQRRLADEGTSFQELIRVTRVSRAGRALLEEKASLTSIALACGFADGAHLSREFRALIGVRPQEFRRVFAAPPSLKAAGGTSEG